MARAYLEVVLSVLGCWGCGYCRGASGYMLVTLGDVSMVGIGDGTTLEDDTVLGIGEGPLGGNLVGVLVRRYVDNIYCRFLMACISSSPTANRDSGSRSLIASSKPYTAWRPASVDESFGTGQSCGKIQLS